MENVMIRRVVVWKYKFELYHAVGFIKEQGQYSCALINKSMISNCQLLTVDKKCFRCLTQKKLLQSWTSWKVTLRKLYLSLENLGKFGLTQMQGDDIINIFGVSNAIKVWAQKKERLVFFSCKYFVLFEELLKSTLLCSV